MPRSLLALLIAVLVLIPVSESFASPAVPESSGSSSFGPTPDFAVLAAGVKAQAIDDRRWLHSHAELSLREFQTHQYLREAIEHIPGVELVAGEWGNGLVAVLAGGREGPLVAWRCDMDGLPIAEETGLEFACTREDTVGAGRLSGVSHACGHDLHMAIGLGLLRVLSSVRDELPGSLLFIAEPGEEIGAGALQLLDAGLFDGGRLPRSVLALHVHPTLEFGQIGTCPGWATANVDGFLLKVKGAGAHGAYPHEGVDPVILAAQMVLAFQTLVTREIDVNHNAVISVGRIEGGAKSNVIPDLVTIEATVRSQDEETRQKLAEKIKRTVIGLAAAAGAPEPEIEYYFGTDAGYNNPELSAQVREVVRRVLGPEADVSYPPGMGGEDFAYFGRGAPSLQFRLGVAAPGAAPMSLHTAAFNPDERAVELGIRIAAEIIWDQLSRY